MGYNSRFRKSTYDPELVENIHCLIGDSNCEGQGVVSELPAEMRATLPIKVYYKSSRSLVDNGSWVPFKCGTNQNRADNLTAHGFETPYAYYWSQAQPNKHRIIKWGLGGSEMLQTSTGGDDWAKASNELYNEFVNFNLIPAYNKVIQEGRIPVVKTFIISLGTNDAATAYTESAGDGFYNIQKNWLDTIKGDCPFLKDTRFIIIQSPPNAPGRANLADVRAAQYNFCNGRSTGTPLLAYPNTVLCNVDDAEKKADLTHYTTPGQIVVGKRGFDLAKI